MVFVELGGFFPGQERDDYRRAWPLLQFVF